ncbi:MAG TPA: hypothetical protein VFZ00_33420 [Solirubrobacter sp.]|nr:hypothetical protein [Solirubrobacter sp.]
MLTKTSSRLAAFAAALAAAGGIAAVVGSATGATPPLQDCLKVAAAQAGVEEAMESMGGEPMVAAIPGAHGLTSELAGVRLETRQPTLAAGRTTWRFRIADCDGKAIRDFEPEQGKLLHLIVVRSDFTGYQHLHPTLHRDGTFTTTIDASRGGRYRALADFVIDGRKYVVGTDLTVPGSRAEAPLPAPALQGSTDGYDVELQRPAVLEAGEEAQLTFRITRAGRPVTDLEPYLGAYGHLVALHAPDLAYSHVHPNGEDRRAGAITFDVELDEPGAYRLFLQFQTRGRVHTVAFTQTVK